MTCAVWSVPIALAILLSFLLAPPVAWLRRTRMPRTAAVALVVTTAVALLAGVFKLEPPALVEGTAYPDAKAERLPLVAARYTEVELRVRLLRRDLDWLARATRSEERAALAGELRVEWRRQLFELEQATLDQRERALLREARSELARGSRVE